MTAALFLLPIMILAFLCVFPSAHSFLQATGNSSIIKYNQAASPAATQGTIFFFYYQI